MLRDLLNSNQSYTAPLHLCDLASRVPDSYTVFLHMGYGLETHKKAVGDGVVMDAVEFVFEKTKHHG